jgi:hypothetical protein
MRRQEVISQIAVPRDTTMMMESNLWFTESTTLSVFPGVDDRVVFLPTFVRKFRTDY